LIEEGAVANISAEALNKLNADREALRFSRTATRITQAGEQPERVEALKQQFNAGNIGDYLSQLDTNSLADTLLASPAGRFLSQKTAA
jgi:anti-sigma28 factor (negative regulator of flagellin synthesis)